MNSRQSYILKQIIEGYAATASPVGSHWISNHAKDSISPATIRNEMAVLEEAGYIEQPHTSAGRTPTIKGLEYYLENLFEREVPSAKRLERLKKTLREDGIKGLAKSTADECQGVVVIAYGLNNYYFTGFSYLFSQPEFQNSSYTQSISEAVDSFESTIPHFLQETSDSLPTIFIGKKNPLGNKCSVACVKTGEAHDTLFGILTPLRTNYTRNAGLLMSISQYI